VCPLPRRLYFICRRFGTHCLFHLHTRVGVKCTSYFIPTYLWRWNKVFRNVGIQNTDAGNCPEEGTQHLSWKWWREFCWSGGSFLYEHLKTFQWMLITCLGKSRDESTTLKRLLLGTVMLFYSTLSRLKSVSILQGHHFTWALSFVTSCRYACQLSTHMPGWLNNDGER